MVRMRFRKMEDGSRSLINPVLVGNELVKVEISEINHGVHQGVATSLDTGNVLATSEKNTVAKVQKELKTKLVTLGAVFDSEVRAKRVNLTLAVAG